MAQIRFSSSPGIRGKARWLCGSAAGPISHHIGSRRRRRLAVLALYAGYPITIAAMWASSTLQHDRAGFWLRAPVVIVLIGAMIALCGGLAILLARTTINVANISDRALDERLRQQRDAAYRKAFGLISVALLVAGSYMMAAPSFGWQIPHSANAVQAVFWGILIVTTTLPTAVLAWSEPDPREDL